MDLTLANEQEAGVPALQVDSLITAGDLPPNGPPTPPHFAPTAAAEGTV